MGDKTDDDKDDDTEGEEIFLKLFNKHFHKAMGERDNRLLKKVTASMGELLDAKLGEALDSKLNAWLEESGNDDDARRGEEPSVGSGKLPPELEARMRASEKEAKEAKDIADKYKKQVEEAKAREKRNEELKMLSDAIAPSVKAKLLDMTVSDLHAKRLVRDEDTDKILWKNDEGELLPFKDGVAEWLKSDQAKELAPPRDVRGTGGRGPEGGGKGGKGGAFSLEDVGAAIINGLPR